MITIPDDVETAGLTPPPGGWVIDFRIMPHYKPSSPPAPSHDQPLSILEQRCRMDAIKGVKAPSLAPCPSGRVVKLGAGNVLTCIGRAPCDQHLAIGQQCRR